ncbi:MAG: hypothetical protein HY917_05385 [Candidatus Diapherotrites archaeon]|nr:hypothetical protein [Candidatus Diapherotrites archaeon]
MSKNRSQEKKEFLIAARKRIAPGITSAPLWAQQKAGKRIYNVRGKRHWRQTDLGMLFKKQTRAQAQGKKPLHRQKRLLKRIRKRVPVR